MTTLAQFSASVITNAGRTIAAKVIALVEAGLPVNDALAIAAELGIAQGHMQGVESLAARLSNQAKHGELPR